MEEEMIDILVYRCRSFAWRPLDSLIKVLLKFLKFENNFHTFFQHPSGSANASRTNGAVCFP